MFTEDEVYEARLVPDGHRLPRRLTGRDAIRAGMSAFHRELPSGGTVDAGQSRLALHEATDPGVFIAGSTRSWTIGEDGVSRYHSCRSPCPRRADRHAPWLLHR
jgi:hypothetical protein